jgi:hypothetical protein
LISTDLARERQLMSPNLNRTFSPSRPRQGWQVGPRLFHGWRVEQAGKIVEELKRRQKKGTLGKASPKDLPNGFDQWGDVSPAARHLVDVVDPSRGRSRRGAEPQRPGDRKSDEERQHDDLCRQERRRGLGRRQLMQRRRLLFGAPRINESLEGVLAEDASHRSRHHRLTSMESDAFLGDDVFTEVAVTLLLQEKIDGTASGLALPPDEL